MKKILVLLFMLMLTCSVCSAGFSPDPNRWEMIAQSANETFYIDAKSVGISNEFDGIHATVWIAVIPIKDKGLTHNVQYADYNLSRREQRVMSITMFGTSGKVRHAYNFPVNQFPFHGIQPGTIAEAMLNRLTEIYKERENSDNKK